MTHEKLIEGLINKEKLAIEYLVDRYQDCVIKTAYYFIDNMEDAEDLSQEVMLEVLRSIHRYNNKGSLQTWIYRITVNKSLDQLRRQKRSNFIQRLESLVRLSGNGENRYIIEPGVADTRNEDIEKRRILDNALNSLPTNQKVSFILSKYEELSYKEIADIMKLSVSSVESLIFRAKMNLQKKLVCYFHEYSAKKKI